MNKLKCPLHLKECDVTCPWWIKHSCKYPSLQQQKQYSDYKAMREVK